MGGWYATMHCPPCCLLVWDSSAGAGVCGGIGADAVAIAAIGAQNTYVLRRGLRREHVALMVVLVCVALDAALMALGIVACGIPGAPSQCCCVRWRAGAGALAWYAWRALGRAAAPGPAGAGRKVSGRRPGGCWPRYWASAC